MTLFRDLNPAIMPGFGDPETWGGRRPYVDYDDYQQELVEAWLEERDLAMIEAAERMDGREPWDWDRMTLDETIDNLEEEYPREQ